MKQLHFVGTILAATTVSAAAQTCDYASSSDMTKLIGALSDRAYAESQDDDYQAACETMGNVIALYNKQMMAFQDCGDMVSAINTQSAARSADRLARSYCNHQSD